MSKGENASYESALAGTIGSACRKARERLGLSQSEVARKLDISEAFYKRIERGAALPRVPTLAALARTLGLSADEMLGRTGKSPAASSKDPPGMAALMPLLLRAPRSTLRLVSLLLRTIEAKAKGSKDQA